MTHLSASPKGVSQHGGWPLPLPQEGFGALALEGKDRFGQPQARLEVLSYPLLSPQNIRSPFLLHMALQLEMGDREEAAAEAGTSFPDPDL